MICQFLVQVLDRSGDEFQMIEAYVKNNHATTHTQHSLRLDEVLAGSPI